MTIERKLIFSLSEIKAIVFECTRCKSRTSIPTDAFHDIPKTCPNGHSMLGSFPPDFAGSMLLGFLTGLKKLKDQSFENAGFELFLELEEPKA